MGKLKKMLGFLFVEEGKLSVKKSSFEEFNPFLHGVAHGLFWNSIKAAKFLLNCQVHFALCGQENYVFQKECVYL